MSTTYNNYNPPIQEIYKELLNAIEHINTYSQKHGHISTSTEELKKASVGALQNINLPTQVKQLYFISNILNKLRKLIDTDRDIQSKLYHDYYVSRNELLINVGETHIEALKRNRDTIEQHNKGRKHYLHCISNFVEHAALSIPSTVSKTHKEKDPVEKTIEHVTSITSSTVSRSQEVTNLVENTLVTNSDADVDLLLFGLNEPAVPAPYIPEPVIEKAIHIGRKNIPKHVKTMVWNVHIGVDKLETKCFSCRAEKIDARHFQCGHIIAEAKGGDLTIKNLRPICQPCNASMGTQSMNEFTQEYFGWSVT